ncbi:MAG TPA: hypothetical protein VFM93_14300 [Candidatus Limnocylindria bacterium]|nr:hypothetical protein [Candidatus Limnocylindria bacterium]
MSPREALRARLRTLGFPFDDEALDRAVGLVARATETPHLVPDLTLMTVAVEAYRRPDVPVREIE